MENNLTYRLTLKDFFRKTMLKATDDTKKLDNGMNKLNTTISKVGTGLATFAGVNAVVSGGKAIIESLKNYEYFSASIRTLMHGDRLAAKSLEGQLITLAAKTPFSLTDVQDGSKQLLAYGFQAGKITDNLKMLGDVASGVGAPLNDVIYLYGTLRTQGRAYTKDIMQFTGRGIPIIKELAKQFKTTEANVQSLVEQGKVGFPQIESAFRSMTSSGGDFFRMMDEQSQTVGGKLSNLSDAWEQLKVNIGKSQTGIIASTTSFASNLVQDISNNIAQVNRLEDAFKKYNIKTYTIHPNSESKLEQERMFKLSQSWESKIKAAAANDNRTGNLQELNKLLKESAIGINDVFKGKSSVNTFSEGNKLIAVLKYAQDDILGNIRLLNTKSDKKQETLGSAAGGSIGSPTEVSGPRPQNININIEKFGTLNIENMSSEHLKDHAKTVKEEWSKELLEVLNDANLIARR